MLTNKNFSLSEGYICRGAFCGSCKPLVILVIRSKYDFRPIYLGFPS